MRDDLIENSISALTKAREILENERNISHSLQESLMLEKNKNKKLLQDYKQQIIMLENQLKKEKSQINSMSQDLDAAKKALQQYQSGWKILEQQNQHLKQWVISLKKQLESTLQQMKYDQQQIAKLWTALDQNKQEKLEIRNQSSTEKKENELKLIEIQKAYEKTKNELLQVQEKLHLVNEEISNSKASWASQERSYQKKIGDYYSSWNLLVQKNKEIDLEKQNLNKKLVEANEVISQHQVKISQLQLMLDQSENLPVKSHPISDLLQYKESEIERMQDELKALDLAHPEREKRDSLIQVMIRQRDCLKKIEINNRDKKDSISLENQLMIT